MKVYVAEQPESCLDCEFCNKENYCCWLLQKDVREYRDECPLHSLSDYTKQVRKEVCEEIKEKAELFGVCKTGTIAEEYRISKNILDQIQGETK